MQLELERHEALERQRQRGGPTCTILVEGAWASLGVDSGVPVGKLRAPLSFVSTGGL